MKQAIIRKTLTGDWEPFEFPKKSGSFFVKNFSNSSIFVSFENNDSDDASFKIPSMYGEEVSISKNGDDSLPFARTTVYIKGTGEVEVQALDIYID